MSEITFKKILTYWQDLLQLHDYHITREKISIHQVCDDNCKTGHSFVGIHTNHETCTACIYHTRKLTIEDLVHELLHVKFPHLTEEHIVREAGRWLLYSRKEVNTN